MDHWSRRIALGVLAAASCGPAATRTARPRPAIPAPAPPAPELPLSPPTPPAQLSDDVTPIAYRLQLDLDPAAPGYAGTVEIDLALARATPSLWWHAAAELELTAVEVRQGDRLVRTTAIVPAAIGADIAGIGFATPLAAGSATVRVAFRRAYRTDQGIFRQQSGGHPFVYSDFEPTDARLGFPCFDEPRWRAPLTLTVRSPDGVAAYANMPVVAETREGDAVVRQFAPTPPLPTYLFAFAVGTFVEFPVPRAAVPTRILAPPSRAQVEYARARLPAILDASTDFVGRPWPWPKLDVVVVPRMRGAMENPGLITIAADIADDPDTDDARALVELVLAHELAHAWFGTAVTPRDWRELWLNEGFATWISDRVLRGPRSLRSDAEHVVDRLAVFVDDDRPARHPLRATTLSGPRDTFDAISYQKGGATLHALTAWLGDATLRAGLHAYLDAHPWGVVDTDDLSAALATAAGGDRAIAATLAAMTTRIGVPRVTLTKVCAAGHASVRVEQRGDRRPVPVCVAWGGAAAGRGCVVVEDVATVDAGAACPTWYRGDADGYLRWRVAPADWAALATAPPHPGEQIATLDAAIDATIAGEATIDQLLAIAGPAITLGDRTSARFAADWLQLIASGAAPGRRPAIAQAVSGAAADALTRLGRTPRPGDSTDRAIARAIALELAGTVGHDRKVVGWATRTVASWRRGANLAPTVIGPALLVAAARGNPRQRALVEAAAYRADPRSSAVAAELGRALALMPDPLARLADDAPRLPLPVRYALIGALLERPDQADAVVAALGPTAMIDLLAATARPCATPTSTVSGFDELLAIRAITATRCRALVARLAP